MSDRVALVIGGASGIGAATVVALTAHRCRVVVADLAGLVVTPLTAPRDGHPGHRGRLPRKPPLGRAGSPEEVAEAVVFVSKAAWLTGEVMDLNGGAHLMRYPDLVGHVNRAFS